MIKYMLPAPPEAKADERGNKSSKEKEQKQEKECENSHSAAIYRDKSDDIFVLFNL